VNRAEARETSRRAKFPLLGFDRQRTFGIPIASALLLLPCYWLPRIYAGDLSSHTYNAWLASTIEGQPSSGLVLKWQWTNILLDLLLSALLSVVDADWAQRLAVSLAILLFSWGAFALCATVANRWPWHILPVIALLAYGWTFHTGLFNFYLSCGFCFWAVACAWRVTVCRYVTAAALFALAWFAHAIPLIWALGFLLYALIHRNIRRPWGLAMPVIGVGLLFVVRLFLVSSFPTLGGIYQLLLTTGADQLWISEWISISLYITIIAVGIHLLLRLLEQYGTGFAIQLPELQFCFLTAVAVAVIPTRVHLPGFNHALGFIAERMSLLSGVMVCVCFSRLKFHPCHHALIGVIMAIFFSQVYVHGRRLHRLERELDRALLSVPLYARVISSICRTPGRVNLASHLIDRACIGRCWSYGNYEPSTGQFRIRATGANSFVLFDYADAWAIETGTYIIRRRDLPLYEVYSCGKNRDSVCVRQGNEGEVAGTRCVLQ